MVRDGSKEERRKKKGGKEGVSWRPGTLLLTVQLQEHERTGQ